MANHQDGDDALTVATTVAQPNVSVVDKIHAPVMAGIALAAMTYVAETIPGLPYYIASTGGLHALRTLDRFRDDVMTTSPLPDPGWERNVGETAASLTMDEICDAAGAKNARSVVQGWRSFRDFRDVYRAGKITPVDVANRILELIPSTHSTPRTLNDLHHINAIAQIDATTVLRDARASQARYEAGKPLSVLDGVPVVVKEEVDVVGYETTCGTRFVNKGNPAERDAHAVARLRALGCLVLGKSTMEEWGWSVFGANSAGGVARNAFDLERSCGGSSSGSAGAVAGGFCPIAIGCDGGGSIRIPASFCGCFGLKPTHGRVSRRGEFPVTSTVSVQGPIATTADDMTVAYLAMAGVDPEDGLTNAQPPVYVPRTYLNPTMSGIRVGVLPAYSAQTSNRAISRQMAFIQRKLVDAGAELVEVDIPDLETIRKAHAIAISCEMFNAMEGRKGQGELYFSTRTMMAAMRTCDARDYVRANQVRTHLIRTLTHLFSRAGHNLHLILTPSTAITAPRLPSQSALRYGLSDVPASGDAMRYAFIANFGGIPAVSCPVGVDDDGMPVGVQFMAEWWAEGRLCEAAKWVEREVVKAGEGIKTPKAWIGDLCKL
ncbi:hypothetical protein HK101_000714 [Irineochytrium annulatum]|nr:hypothetical protein HK101_000714 [Irineochytrium annulatum]